MKTEIKHRFSGEVLFAHEAESNTLVVTLQAANLDGANLDGANLRGANLAGANLDGANLDGANLDGADLRGANLRGADLRGADLWNTTGNNQHIKTIQAGKWTAAYTDTRMQIGCQQHDIKAWWKFTDEEIGRMSGDALAWWKVWKPILKKIIKFSPAAPTGYVEVQP